MRGTETLKILQRELANAQNKHLVQQANQLEKLIHNVQSVNSQLISQGILISHTNVIDLFVFCQTEITMAKRK